MKAKAIQILLVEDDEVDREAIQRAFSDARIANAITVAGDGVEALEILRGNAERRALPKPYTILLDLNMPRMDGLKFLEQLREDPNLCGSVVFVLTTSERGEDIISAYKHKVAGYILKAAADSQFTSLIKLLHCHWKQVEFPV